MTIPRFLTVAAIVVCTSVGWFILGGAVTIRSNSSESRLTQEVVKNWGPELIQEQPTFFYEAPTGTRTIREIQPESSDIRVSLNSDPKQKGLLWYRTYTAGFAAEYLVKNPTPIAQTVYVVFKFPAANARYDGFSLQFGEKVTDKAPIDGEIRESHLLGAGAQLPLKISYRSAGMNSWTYSLRNARRLRDLHLTMVTDFRKIDFPATAVSTTSRKELGKGMELHWDYTDVLGAEAIAMEMPAVTNPGAVAGRMTFFAPVSLLFFFSVLVIVAIRERLNLHPMNYFFMAAGCFAFQLLFAYLVDLLPLTLAFIIAAATSLLLVNGYLWMAAGPKFARISAVAQSAYMVLFSYSFFFEGLTGITITVGAVITLALLMISTARTNWDTAFGVRQSSGALNPEPDRL